MPEIESVQEEEVCDGDMGDVEAMDESDGDKQEDSEGFKEVLSRRWRKKQRVNKGEVVEGNTKQGGQVN